MSQLHSKNHGHLDRRGHIFTAPSSSHLNAEFDPCVDDPTFVRVHLNSTPRITVTSTVGGVPVRLFLPKISVTIARPGPVTPGQIDAAVEETTIRMTNAAKRAAEDTMVVAQPHYGRDVHNEMARIVKSWNDDTVRAEVPFRNGIEGVAGRDSVRLDAVKYGSDGSIIAVYDLKTGNAVLDAARVAQIRANLPLNAQNVPIIEIKLNVP